MHTDGERTFVRKDENDACVFMQPDRLCGIHAERGYDAKPVICRMYPFEPVPTPDGFFVSASFRCTAIQQNVGRPMAAHEEGLKALVAEIIFHQIGFKPTVVADETTIDWDGYKALEAFLFEQLAKVGPEHAMGQVVYALCEEVIRSQQASRLLDRAIVEAALARQVAGRLESHPILMAQVEFVLLATLAYLEGLDLRQLVDAIHAGQPIQLPMAKWNGTFADLEQGLLASVGDRYEGQIARYLKALIFAKQLMMFFNGSVLSVLVTMYLYPRILRIYTAAFASAHWGEASDADCFRAIDICERQLATHARHRPPFVGPFACSFVDQIRLIQTGEARPASVSLQLRNARGA